MMQTIKDLNALIAERYPSVHASLVHSPAWGHDDCVILFRGEGHELAAADFQTITKGVQKLEIATDWDDNFEPVGVYRYSSLTWKP